MIIWIIGISGTGKTTIGKKLFNKIKRKHFNTVFLDGDILRNVWGDDLGHKISDRKKCFKNSKIMPIIEQTKIHVVCCLLSIFPLIQQKARKNIKKILSNSSYCPNKRIA